MPLKRKASNSIGDSPSIPKAKRERAANTKWEKEDIDSIVTQLKQATVDGNTSDNGVKKNVWVAIAISFTDPLKNDRSCQTRFSRLKVDYKEVKYMRELSGFGWDLEKHVPTAEDDVWNVLEKVSISIV
jgi:hypothetical protein